MFANLRKRRERSILPVSGRQHPGHERDAHARGEILVVGARSRAEANPPRASRAAALRAQLRDQLRDRDGVQFRGPERRHRRGAKRQRGARHRQLLFPTTGAYVAASGASSGRRRTEDRWHREG